MVPDAHLHGAPPGPGRLPGNAHLGFPGCEGDSMLMLLDARGIESVVQDLLARGEKI